MLNTGEVMRDSMERNSLGEGRFSVEYSWALKWIMIIGVLFFGAIFVINIGTYTGIWSVGTGVDLSTVIFFGLFLLFYIASFAGIVIWRIKVDKESICYRNYLGITKKYRFSDLDSIVEKKNRKLLVYQNGKRIFSIDNNLPTGVYFLYCAKKYGVQVVKEK